MLGQRASIRSVLRVCWAAVANHAAPKFMALLLQDVMVVCNVPLLLDSVLQEAGKELAAGERAGAGSSSGSGSGSGGSEEEQGRREQLQACVAALRRAMQPMWTSNVGGRTLRRFNEIQGHLPAALRLGTPLAAALLDWWRRPEAQQAAALELAQAAARRSCAYLRCGNLGGEGGPAAGEGVGSQRCRWVTRAVQPSWIDDAAGCIATLLFLPHFSSSRGTRLRLGLSSFPAFHKVQCMPRGVVLRHRLLARRLASGSPPRVQGAGCGTGGGEGAAAAAGNGAGRLSLGTCFASAYQPCSCKHSCTDTHA